jgi:mRNA-degrading endonuclease RelE of RelBE toxin-antitoxin system
MSWKIEVKPTAEKYYLRLDKRTRKRIREALDALEREVNPLLHRDMRPLTGKLQCELSEKTSERTRGRKPWPQEC